MKIKHIYCRTGFKKFISENQKEVLFWKITFPTEDIYPKSYNMDLIFSVSLMVGMME